MTQQFSEPNHSVSPAREIVENSASECVCAESQTVSIVPDAETHLKGEIHNIRRKIGTTEFFCVTCNVYYHQKNWMLKDHKCAETSITEFPSSNISERFSQ